MCFFLLYSDAAGTVPAMFGSAMIRQVIIAVPKKVVAANSAANVFTIAASGLTKKIEALFQAHGDASPPGVVASMAPPTLLPVVAPLW